MVNVAIAGGNGGVGRALVEAIVAQGKHKVAVLSRENKLQTFGQNDGYETVEVDYTSIESLTKTLHDNQIHTVISAISAHENNDSELNLIRAAEASQHTKRFIPSTWGIPFSQKHADLFPPAGLKIQALAEVSKTSLEYTRVNNGFFLDYWGGQKIKTYLRPYCLVVDIENNAAGIPGSGDVPIVFTHTFDIAKFVAAMLDLPRWDKETYIIGDKVTWNEFVKLAEAAKGTTFEVTHDSVEMLEAGRVTELPDHRAMYQFIPKEKLQSNYAVFGLFFNDESCDLKPEHTLNKDFPNIHVMNVKEFLEKAWKN